MTWDEVLKAVGNHQVLMYKAPLDHEPRVISVTPTDDPQVLQVWGTPWFDRFLANAGHQDRFSLQTFLAPEEHAYPKGGQTRKGLARFPDGRVRRVWGGIPDTFFTIPAHGWMKGKSVTGYLTCDEDRTWVFHVSKKSLAKAASCGIHYPAECPPSYCPYRGDRQSEAQGKATWEKQVPHPSVQPLPKVGGADAASR